MIKIQTQETAPVTVIRSASSGELTEYEKKKLAKIEEQAQQNKIEAIRINDKRASIDPKTKVAQINVGDLAFKSAVSPADIDTGELFFIKCSLD